jgi:LCP family protein required for cell wall assembly
MIGRTADRAHTARPLANGGQRLLYAFAVFTLFIASMYAGLATLARVTPALFPGRSLRNVGVVAVIDKVAPVPEPSESSAFKDPIRVLVLGVDKRANEAFDERGTYLTDVIMVASIDPVSKKSTMLSFPRDLLIDVHTEDGDISSDRFNMSYQIGVLEGGNWRAGARQVQRDLEENFGIETDYYLLLDFEGVERLVDAVGGVQVDVPPDLAVSNWWYSDDDKTHVQLTFPPGINRLDGYHAVAFGRNRDGDSDLFRIKRQQLVIKAAVDRLFSSGILARNPMDLWDAYNTLVKTDIPRAVMPGLADLGKRTNGSMALYSIGDPVDDIPTVEDHITPWGEAVLLWNPENVQYWLSRAFPSTRHADAVIELRNAYGDPQQGESRTTALGKYLVYSRGLVTVYYGEDMPVTARTSVVLHRESHRLAAQDIATWLSLDRDRVVLDEVPAEDTYSPDITVVVGSDFVIPGTR